MDGGVVDRTGVVMWLIEAMAPARTSEVVIPRAWTTRMGRGSMVDMAGWLAGGYGEVGGLWVEDGFVVRGGSDGAVRVVGTREGCVLKGGGCVGVRVCIRCSEP